MLERDLRRQQRARITHRQQQLRFRELIENFRDVIAIGRSFFNPAFYPVERNAYDLRVRFHHQHQQISVHVGGIESHSLECLEKFLFWKLGVVLPSAHRLKPE